MKRYMLFYGDWHYACGGMKDFIGSFDTQEEAKKAIPSDECCVWFHIYDIQEMKIVTRGTKKYEDDDWE